MRILVVDDSPAQCLILATMLRSAGYADVVTVYSATAAYAALHEAELSQQVIDLILMDLRMPGIDGIAACQTIKASESLQDIPILMITSSDDLSDLTRAFAAGAMDYISKPPNTIELLARLQSALRLKHEIDQRKTQAKESVELMGQLQTKQHRSDQLLLDLRAEQARSEQMAADLRRQNERFQRDLVLAHNIQLSLLPQRSPWNPNDIAAAGLSIPASEVGGDFFTYIEFRDPQLIGVVIGDISGKGVGAALMMALVLSAVETQARDVHQPRDLLPLLNNSLRTHLKRNQMNAGLLYILIDRAQQLMWVANAGMVAPLLIRAGALQAIDVFGLPLGAMANADYQEIQIQLQPEDLIVLVSDGIVEAHNSAGELFGFERLERVLRNHLDPHTPSRLIRELMDATRAFTGGCEQHDDMTVVALCPNPRLVQMEINVRIEPDRANVVIIDDSVDSLMIMQEFLEEMGGVNYCVAHTSGSEFLKWCDDAIDGAIHLILLDIEIPYENGFVIAQKLRALPGLNSAKIVAVTAHTDAETVAMARTGGFDGFISKPLSLERFPTQVQRILAGEAVWEPR